MIHKKILIQGEKGDTGSVGTDTTVPMNGIIAYKGDTVPDGYILYSEVPDGVLTHITATYTQTATITDASSLDDLRPDLVVKAVYYDAETGITSEYVVTDYTLSGTLEVGTSAITASYKGKTDTFDVTVESSINYLYKWDLTQSLTDQKQGIVATLGGNATFTQGVGVIITDATSYLYINEYVRGIGRTIEVDFSNMNKAFADNKKGRLLGKTYNQTASFTYDKNNNGWRSFTGTTSIKAYTQTSDNADVFDGKTFKFVENATNDLKVYANDVLVYDGYDFVTSIVTSDLTIGNVADAFYNMTITGVRIYANQ